MAGCQLDPRGPYRMERQRQLVDESDGGPTQLWALDAAGARTGEPVKTGYDAWGRQVSYEPSAGQVTTTTYDTVGRVVSTSDPKGSRTFGYGTDATGAAERRALPTTVSVSGGPGGDVTFAGAYNADGTLVLEKLPGDLSRETVVDMAGEPVSLTYRGQVTTVHDDETTTVDPDGGWLGWSVDVDHQGRVRREWTPMGAAFSTGGLETGAAGAYDRGYVYDGADRLVRVDDRTAPAGAGFDEATGDPTGVVCETRSYAFDANGNRTGLTRTPGNADGSCNAPGTAGETSRSWSYDAGDRITGGYVYDAFGRATTVPAADAPSGSGAGDIALGYHDTDAIASITQGGSTTAFTLDAAARRLEEKSGPSGQAPVSTITRHYTDAGDNPAWATTATSEGTSVTRFESSLGGDLGLTLTSPPEGGTVEGQLALADPHGDTVATVPVPATGAAVGIEGWVDHDEYGNPLGDTSPTSGAVTDGLGYGWLGAKERATLETGLMLMGARIYNRVTGQFTSTDPVFGGNLTAYGYPTDPINEFDLSGMCKSTSWRDVGRFLSRNRGAVATAGATAGCLVPAVGWAACGGMQAGALGVRSQQRSSRGGGWRRTWRSNARDTILTVTTFGVGQAGRYGQRALDITWRNKRTRKAWAATTAALSAPSSIGVVASARKRWNKWFGK